MTKLLVSILSLEFHGQNSARGRGEGFYIDPDGFTGWDDGVDMRRDEVARAGRHGSYPTRGTLDSRVVSISGWCRASSPEVLGVMGSSLTGLLADGGAAQVSVEHQGRELWALGMRSSKPKFAAMKSNRHIAAYQLQLWFPDPHKFSPARSLSAPANVPLEMDNGGNTAASPRYDIDGDMPAGYSIVLGDGRTITVSRAVTIGHPHSIDTSTGYLRIDGIVVFGAVISAATWSIPGGGTLTQTLVPAAGTGAMTITVEDPHI